MPSDLKIRIKRDLDEARKRRDKERTLVLSTLLSDIRNREIEVGSEVDDDGVVQVLGRGIKQRRDTAEQMRAAGRDELAEQEAAQAAVLETYMPEAMSEDEVRRLVREAIASGATDIGRVMSTLMPRIRGRFDGKEANRIAREELAS